MLGFVAVTLALYVWNVLGSHDQLLDVGSQTGGPGAFEPGIAVWIVLLAGVLLMGRWGECYSVGAIRGT